MTKTVTTQESGVAGDHRYVVAEVDITSLDSAGAEPFDPSSLFGLSTAYGVAVLDQENPTHLVDYDKDNTQLRVRDRGPEYNAKSADPDSQTYGGSTDTDIATYDAGSAGALWPLNFNPADPSDAGLSIALRAVYHNGDTTDIVDISDGTEQTFENLVDGFPTGDDGKEIKELKIVVSNNAGDVTEDIGSSTVEFLSVNSDTENNTDVGTVTLKVEGDWST